MCELMCDDLLVVKYRQGQTCLLLGVGGRGGLGAPPPAVGVESFLQTIKSKRCCLWILHFWQFNLKSYTGPAPFSQVLTVPSPHPRLGPTSPSLLAPDSSGSRRLASENSVLQS